ncbi:MAG: PAS domain S-box protein, partial [Deltaproteobacteria bacterium]
MKDRDDANRKAKDLHSRAEKRPKSQTSSLKSPSPAEEVFAPEHEKCRVLVESAPLGIAIIGSNGLYKYLNPKFIEMFGYTLDDIPTGKAWFVKAYPDSAYRHQVISDWKMYLEESQLGEAEPRIFTVTCKDGSAKVIKFRAVPLEDGEQFILYEDFTERQQTEEALRESETRFRQLVESAADAFFLIDAGQIIEVNQQACDSLGYSREELLGMFMADIEIGISPEELASAWRKSLFSPITILGTHKRKDGFTFPVEVRVNDFDFRGRRLRLALVRDITERRQAEENLRESEKRFRQLVESAADALFLSYHQKIIEVNQQACDSLGYSREELLGMSVRNIEIGLDPKLLSQLCRQLDHPITLLGVHKRKDGSSFPVEVRLNDFDYGGKKVRLAIARDITERLQAQEALRESELKYRTLVEQIPAITFISPLDNFVTPSYVSPQVEYILGFSPADFEADPNIWVKQLHPEDREWVLAEVARCQKTGDPFDCEYRILTRDGRIIWFQDKAHVVHDSSGQHLFLQGVSVDITHRKELEEALQESETHYRTLFETSPDPILLFDTDLKLSMVNPAAATLYGVEQAEEMVGMSAFDFVAPESLALAQKLDQERTTQENFVEAEFVLLKKDGSHFIAETRTSILQNSDGSPKAFLSVAKDITERKRNEEKLRQAKEEWEKTFDTIPDLIMILDNQHRIVRANRAMAQKLGCSPDEAIGLTCYQAVHDSETPPPFCPHSLMLVSGLPQQVEISEEKLNGHFIVSVTPLFDSDGRTVGSVHVAIDISERKLAEEALQYSEEKYRLLVQQIPALGFKIYKDWSIEFFDDKIETLTGYHREDFNSGRLSWQDVIPEEDLPYLMQIFQEARKGDGSYLHEHRVRKKNGEYLWVQCLGRIFYDEQGDLDYISGVTFDITAQKQTETALQESEARYRLITENVSDVIWTTNLDLQVSYVSPSIQYLLGFTPEEIKSRPLGEVLPPESLGQALEIFSEEMAREKEKYADPQRTRTLELRQHRKDGSVIWTELNASFLRDDNHQPIGILGVTRDITERKQAETILRRRERTLEAVSFASERFLKSHHWEQDIQKVLERLGRALEISRISIFENHRGKNNTLLASLRHQWVAAKITSQIDTPEFQGFPFGDGGFGRWEELLPQGQIIWGHVSELPPAEKEVLAAHGLKSIAAVPIFVGQQWWGGIVFDDSTHEREWSSLEIDALLTAASILGLTILHQREEEALRESEEKLRFLSSKLLMAQEQERKRLATELHDILGHDLVLLKLKLETLEKELLSRKLSQRRKVKHIIDSLHASLKNLHRLHKDLTSGGLEDLGLTSALYNLLEEFATAQQITWQVDLDNLDGLLDLSIQTTIYRLVQEALTNIGKHANAKCISFWAKKEPTVASFAIEDDGRGFNLSKVLATKKTMGLISMEPQSGYSIISTFESGRYRWSGSPGSVYPILKRLEK